METEAGSSAAASTDLVQISVLRDRIDSAMEELADLGVFGHLHLTGGPYPEGEPPEDGKPAGHEHDWQVSGVQEMPAEFIPLGKPVPRTAVLARCGSCGEPRVWLLPGTWTQDDFGG
jgi:hypothetical protein